MARTVPHCCLEKESTFLLALTPFTPSRLLLSIFLFSFSVCVSRVSVLTLLVSTFLWLPAGYDMISFSLTPSRNAANVAWTRSAMVTLTNNRHVGMMSHPMTPSRAVIVAKDTVSAMLKLVRETKNLRQNGIVTCPTWGLCALQLPKCASTSPEPQPNGCCRNAGGPSSRF